VDYSRISVRLTDLLAYPQNLRESAMKTEELTYSGKTLTVNVLLGWHTRSPKFLPTVVQVTQNANYVATDLPIHQKLMVLV